MHGQRQSGILLHPTSLPGPFGSGDLGPDAHRWLETLQAMGQQLWQILPHGVTGFGDSPYQSFSTFAGNPLWINFDRLVEQGLLTPAEVAAFPRLPAEAVAFERVIPARQALLATAGRLFARRADPALRAAFERFCAQEAGWLEDFALFMALKDAHELRPWTTWAPDLVRRAPAALARARRDLADAVTRHKVQQFLFDEQWRRLRVRAHQLGIRLIGDIPIFVAHDSADAWAHPELFYLDEQGQPTVVAGVPPDYFSATGQLWGNPLYRWDVHRQTQYAWWAARLRKIFDLVDIVRIDHFRGFEAYWEIPGGAATAEHGRWVPGPGADLFEALRRQLGELPVIAEDLGVITPPVEALRDRFAFPGMRVLQFCFGQVAEDPSYHPEQCLANCVIYTGTHDNDTTAGWFHSAPGEGNTRSAEDLARERDTVRRYLGTDGREIHWDLLGLAWRSTADTALAPLQDVLGLGSAARMNRPGITGGNWRWRFRWEELSADAQARLRRMTRETGRGG